MANVKVNRHFAACRVWARILAQTWHAAKCPVERWLGRIPKHVGAGDWDKPLAKQVAFVLEPGSAGLFGGKLCLD